MKNSFYTHKELCKIGFQSFGDGVLISRKTSFYNPEKMIIGNNVRIDDFCLFSGKIIIGSYVHISAYCALYGKNGIYIDNFSGLSPRCTVFSATDDFSGSYLIGPMVDKSFTNVLGGSVYIKKYVQIGAGSIILPDITLGEGLVAGAMSLIKNSFEGWQIIGGIPATLIKRRNKDLLKYIQDNYA